jgi:hypothetical protein
MIRGDIVSLELTTGMVVELPDDWGLIHDPSGIGVDRCELFIAPFIMGRRMNNSHLSKVGDDARSYYGYDQELHGVTVEIPEGPWERVGDIAVINYDRHGELKGPYYHDTDVPKRRSERAILMRQRTPKPLFGRRVKAFRISLPDGCRINAHGFIWP